MSLRAADAFSAAKQSHDNSEYEIASLAIARSQ